MKLLPLFVFRTIIIYVTNMVVKFPCQQKLGPGIFANFLKYTFYRLINGMSKVSDRKQSTSLCEFKLVVKCIFEYFEEVFFLCNSNIFFCINCIERGVNVRS